MQTDSAASLAGNQNMLFSSQTHKRTESRSTKAELDEDYGLKRAQLVNPVSDILAHCRGCANFSRRLWEQCLRRNGLHCLDGS